MPRAIAPLSPADPAPDPCELGAVNHRLEGWRPPAQRDFPYFPGRPYTPFPENLAVADLHRIEKSIKRKLLHDLRHALPPCHEIHLLPIAWAGCLSADEDRQDPDELSADRLRNLVVSLFDEFCMDQYLKNPSLPTPKEKRSREEALVLRNRSMADMAEAILESRSMAGAAGTTDQLSSSYKEVFERIGDGFCKSGETAKRAYLDAREERETLENAREQTAHKMALWARLAEVTHSMNHRVDADI